MAKTYAERNRESIEKYGKSLYQRRIEAGLQKGLSRAQARGHARVAKGEKPASLIRKEKKFKPPKITRRVVNLPSGTKVVTTRSTNQVYRVLSSPNSKGKRVYFQVFNPTTGEFVKVYFGREKRTSPHGMTVQEFLDRVRERQRMGMSVDEAIRDTLVTDSSENAGVDSPETEAVEYDFSNVTMYIR